ncbi:MAG: septal ring lytic transglycosylase RlpA family protein [Gemmatimonadota bacterium]
MGWSQTGIASWYGPGFHGRRTASGEIFDMEAMTAAHKTLPFGTRVRVMNLENGRATSVRINDRGPFVRGRIIDLSRAAARSIHMLGPGTARVRIAVVGTSSLARCAYVQVGAFARAENADRLAARLRRAGEPVRVRTGPDGLTRVLLGPYGRPADAERARRRHDGVLTACG